MRAGFVGLGAMGEPMARNLHRAGLLTALWNRTAAKAQALAEALGCRASPTITDLAAACDVVVLCVSADDDVIELVEALAPAATPGTIVVDCSTTRPDTARRAATILEHAGAHFLDCPVTGGTEGAARGTLSILVGGDEAVAAQARPVLEAMGRGICHLGPSGAGQASKAINQIMVAGINQAVSEGLALARAEGLPLDLLIEALGGGAGGSWFLAHRGPNMVRDRYPLGFKVGLHSKDLEICRGMARAHGVQLPIVEMTLLHYRRLLEAGADDQDISSLHRLKMDLFEKRRHAQH